MQNDKVKVFSKVGNTASLQDIYYKEMCVCVCRVGSLVDLSVIRAGCFLFNLLHKVGRDQSRGDLESGFLFFLQMMRCGGKLWEEGGQWKT